MGTQLAAGANNLVVLGSSLALPQPNAPQSDFLDRSIRQMNNLVQGIASAAVMAEATVSAERDWRKNWRGSINSDHSLISCPSPERSWWDEEAQCFDKEEEAPLPPSYSRGSCWVTLEPCVSPDALGAIFCSLARDAEGKALCFSNGRVRARCKSGNACASASNTNTV